MWPSEQSKSKNIRAGTGRSGERSASGLLLSYETQMKCFAMIQHSHCVFSANRRLKFREKQQNSIGFWLSHFLRFIVNVTTWPWDHEHRHIPCPQLETETYVISFIWGQAVKLCQSPFAIWACGFPQKDCVLILVTKFHVTTFEHSNGTIGSKLMEYFAKKSKKVYSRTFLLISLHQNWHRCSSDQA